MLGDLKTSAFWGVVSLWARRRARSGIGSRAISSSKACWPVRTNSFDSCPELTGVLRRSLFARDMRVFEGIVLGVDAAVMTADHKASLRAKSGALAVDMESHVAARWARKSDLPFSIVRVVSDPAHRALPPIAATALKPNGDVDILRVLSGLARAPKQIGALSPPGRDSRAAFAALDGAGPCLGSRPAAYMPVVEQDEELAPA